MRIALALFVLHCLSFSLHAQQAGQYSLFMLNPFHNNPAYAGMDFAISTIAGVRSQWVGLEGAPASQYIDAHAPFELLGGGIGIKLERDVYGAARQNWASVSYSYQIRLGDGTLGFGIGAGILQSALDGSKLRTPNGIYQNQLFDHQDNILPLNRVQGLSPTLESGLFFQSARLDVGLGVRHFNSPVIDMGSFSTTILSTGFAHIGLHLELSRLFSVHPVVQLRSDAVEFQTDAGITFRYAEQLFAGFILRGYESNSLDAIGFLGGLNLNERWSLGYAYDMTLSALQQVSDGSHELVLRYTLPRVLGARRPPRIIYNPRNL